MTAMEPPRAITFDFGQTLVALDHAALAQRLEDLGVGVDPRVTSQGEADAWRAYEAAKRAGAQGADGWCAFMAALLLGAGLEGARTQALARTLFELQRQYNLWRRPIPGMLELVRELRASGLAVGVLSNSEGKLRELIVELGLLEDFDTITDSGVLGFEKPDPRIFHHTFAQLSVSAAAALHVGDSWEADVLGARGVGARAVWFAFSDGRALPQGVESCFDSGGLRELLRRQGLELR